MIAIRRWHSVALKAPRRTAEGPSQKSTAANSLVCTGRPDLRACCPQPQQQYGAPAQQPQHYGAPPSYGHHQSYAQHPPPPSQQAPLAHHQYGCGSCLSDDACSTHSCGVVRHCRWQSLLCMIRARSTVRPAFGMRNAASFMLLSKPSAACARYGGAPTQQYGSYGAPQQPQQPQQSYYGYGQQAPPAAAPPTHQQTSGSNPLWSG